jgi:ketosteroid isomerase-like protein
MPTLADTFIYALQRLESERDADTIANLFADGASVSNPLVAYDKGGVDAARTFWTHYRDAFDEIRSEFKAVTEADGMAFLEWRSSGSVDGAAFEYGGVSVLEAADGKIASFRTYFDTAQIPRARSTGGEGSGRSTPSADSSSGASSGPSSGSTASGTGTSGEDNDSGDLEKAQREAAEQRAAGGYS